MTLQGPDSGCRVVVVRAVGALTMEHGNTLQFRREWRSSSLIAPTELLGHQVGLRVAGPNQVEDCLGDLLG